MGPKFPVVEIDIFTYMLQGKYDIVIGRRAYYVISRPYRDEFAKLSLRDVLYAEPAKYNTSLFFTLQARHFLKVGRKPRLLCIFC